VRRLFRWVIGLLSVLAIWRVWSRRHYERDVVVAEPDPAEELRRKLAETRADDEPSVTDDTDAATEESLDERRARVHAKAQEAIDAMREEEEE
jgi:hypothetical protein